MPATPDDSNAAVMQAMFQAGQSFAQGFMHVLAGQRMALHSVGASAPPPVAVWGTESAEAGALRQQWAERQGRLWQAMIGREAGTVPPVVASPEPGDKRFDHPAWTESPLHDYLRQSYLINADILKKMAETLPPAQGMSRERIRFLTSQYLDAMAPSNFAATNPEFVAKALETKGESITQGIKNLIGDLEKGRISMTDDEAFEVGRNLAITPGAVVFENDLMQLIQYSPLTQTVARRPLVIVPPCINKFYILDLQPANSFVRHAVSQGQTVFLVSWRNVKADLGHKTWDDYIEEGPLRAFTLAREICGVEDVNALGFCVGGTLVAAALAVAAARGDKPVASLTLLTTLLDFSDPGELGCFIDETSVANREATIGKGGLLRGKELAAVFSALRANDLIWQYVVGNYLKGGKPRAFDLLYWNADATNLPGPFLAWYLRHLYLENGLREPGKLPMCGVRADLGRLDMPTYFLATREDHIVPWRTAYLGRELLGGATTFVLGASGHVAGIVNPPSQNKRSHWINDGTATSPEEWLAAATEVKGSWWSHWTAWLDHFNDGEVAARGCLGDNSHAPREPAPGRYVKEKA